MKVLVPDPIPNVAELGRVHFVGIGGAGLSGIARIMLELGVEVSGCDAQESAALTALRELGARCAVGHSADHVADVDTVVVSTAVKESNPDVLAAQEQQLRLLPRSAALDSVMQGRRVISVAGTHGKTTTTSLLTVALRHCGADPTFAIGGDLTSLGTNAQLGSGDLFVAEADESDGAFLVYSTYAGIVTNVDPDHLDIWGTSQAYVAAFEEFAAGIDPSGFLVACVDDPGAAALAEHASARGVKVLTVGTDAAAQIRLVDLEFAGSTSSCAVLREGVELGRLSLQIPGEHYLTDAVAALATGLELGYPFEDLVEGLGSFTGTRRRMEFKGEVAGIRVYDSYAHHPTEISGDLKAARAVAGAGRLITAFQPHMVSRTRIFGAQMGHELGAADAVVVLDIYLAREEADPRVSAAAIAQAVPLPPELVVFEPDFDAVADRLIDFARPGDMVLTLGAGTVTSIAGQVLARLSGQAGAQR